MSIKTQKIIRFIPLLNIVVTFFSLLKAHHNSRNARVSDIIKFVITEVLAMLLVHIPASILLHILGYDSVAMDIISYVASYADMFVVSSLAILQQEKYMKRDMEEQQQNKL